MRTLLTTAAAAVLAAGIAAPAAAQEAAPFTGFRAEALVGYDNLRDGSDGDSEGTDGVTYGGAVGYDFQFGGVIAGAEAELTESSVDGVSRSVFVPGDALRVGAGRDIYVGGRVGFLVSPVAMVYGKAGYTNARVGAIYNAPGVSVREEGELDGFRLGAGLEFQLSRNLYVKGEYRYSNYGDFEGVDTDADRHQIVGGVGFRF